MNKLLFASAAALALSMPAANAQMQPGPQLYHGQRYIYAPSIGYFGPADKMPPIPRKPRNDPPPPPVYEPVTSGNGCANFGKVIVEIIEKAAAERRKQKGYSGLSLEGAFLAVIQDFENDGKVHRIFNKYHTVISSERAKLDGRDIFIPGNSLREALYSLKSSDKAAFRTCFPNTRHGWKSIQHSSLSRRRTRKKPPAKPIFRSTECSSAISSISPSITATRSGKDTSVQYVNDAEIRRATVAVQAIVKKAQADDSSIDTNKLWNAAYKAAGGIIASQSYCKMYMNKLLDMSPDDPYDIKKPF